MTELVSEPVPGSHVDLLTAPIVGVLSTLMPGGQPHSCLVWVGYDGTCASINTTLERQSGRNLLANRSLSLLVVDPQDTGRYLQIRGDCELISQGAIEHLDTLTRAYTRHPSFYGYVYPQEQRERETRVIVRVKARRITVDAIHRCRVRPTPVRRRGTRTAVHRLDRRPGWGLQQ